MTSYVTSFTVNRADLDFMLKQIQIAETTSIAYTSTPKTITQAIVEAYGLTAANAAIAPYGLRTVDGSFNSLIPGQSKFGAADTIFPRLTDPVFRNDTDGDSIDFDGPGGMPRMVQGNYGNPGTVVDADPRIISNLIVDMSVNNPAALSIWFSNPLAVAAWQGTHLETEVPVAPGQIATPELAQEWADAHPGLTAVALTNADLATIPNQSPDIGLSPGFNAWMTFFGQFFDHGLDLVTKGNNGTVYIPLQPDDPLIAGADGILGGDGAADDLPPHLRFMALTRATSVTLNGVTGQENTTTSFVDQNQTYTSHPSHQVFLREYTTLDDKTVATGRLLDGSSATGSLDGAIGNWAEVKAQALQYLGIRLNDFDVHNVPLLLTDQYGRFVPGANGFAQMVMAPDASHTTNWLRQGTAAGITTEGAIGTNHAFLNDIVHHATPGRWDSDGDHFITPADAFQVADSAAGVADDGLANTYDDEMLNAHFVTGDGRGNENIALTAVHSLFHSEHNRLVAANKETILASGDRAFINEWLLKDLAAAEPIPTNASALVWDGERLFQAARFATEMQYQHLVFEEFARRVQPMVDPFIFNSSPDVDPTIVAEFAHTVYRFGHSMLTGTVDRLDNNLDLLNGDLDQKSLLAVFLNPQAYIGSGATLDEVNANLIRGLSRDVGNAIDELIVSDVRSNLLGLPLDLAALNLSRGRETGIPSLNQTRAQLYNDTGLADLKPYASWAEFAQNIKNAASVVNFIAAYGTHETITGAVTLADKRAAAEAIVFNAADGPADRLAFLNGTDAYAGGGVAGAAGTHGGLDMVDLWIGGLAEESPEFGGMLGTTFNYVFEFQMEALQFGDRLYYLTRTQGLNFLNQLEPNSFSDMVMRNTALGDIYSTHVNGDLFVTPDHIIELDRGIAQEDYNGSEPGRDPEWDGSDPIGGAILGPMVVRNYAGSSIVDGVHDVGGYLRVLGGSHYVLGGTEGNDSIHGDRGLDTLWGDGGNDYLNGMTESDNVFGGAGNDIIEDPFGDDVLRGNQGNDVISTSRGADLVFGDDGADYLLLGQDASEVFGGTGGDFILGGAGKDFLLGNEGDDWMEGGAGFDTLAGDNSELFFNSAIAGHDVLFGHGDETDYDAESGDDIMGSGPSVFRYEGMFGFDWGIAKNDISGVRFDLAIPLFTTIPTDVLRDRFDQTEGLSGWKFDDVLDGDDRGHKGGGSSAPDAVPTELFADHLLTQEGIDRIDGMQEWIQVDATHGARQTLFGLGVPGAQQTSYRDGNILMGGDGSDFLRGRGGYDLLDGDAWLNVRIKIVHNGVTYSAESMTSDTVVAGPNAGKVFNTNVDGTPDFSSPAFSGASLTSLMLNGTIDPGSLSIVREILDGTTGAGETDNDTAIFQGALAEYTIEGRTTSGPNGSGFVITEANDVNGDGFISVQDRDTGAVGAIITGPDGQPLQLSSRGLLTDDLDLLKNIELLRFADQTIRIAGANNVATGTVTISDPTPFDLDGNPGTPALVTPYVGQVLTATLSGVTDADGLTLVGGLPAGLTFEWQTTETGSNAGWSTIHTGDTYTVRAVDPGHILRAVAVFKDALGTIEAIFSAPTDGATAAFRVDENSATGTLVAASIPFNPDYDPAQTPGGPTDGDIVALTHVLADNAGGRFQLVTVGGVQQLRVLNGGTANLDFETQNEYQIVVNSYIDAATAAAANPAGLIASRQFTVLLNNVEPESVGVAPTDIQWNGVTPGDGTPLTGLLAPGLPTAGTVIANLATTDADTTSGFVYSLAAGSSAGFAVSAAGVVTRTGSAMAQNTTYTINVSSTDTTGSTRTETFTIRTGTNSLLFGTNGANTITADATDNVIYGSGGNDNLNGSGGNDNLFGQAGDDTLTGDTGNDNLVGGSGTDALTGGAGADTLTGGAGTDAAIFANAVGNYSFGSSGLNIRVTADTGAEGTDTINTVETLRFNGVNYTVVTGTTANNAGLNGAAGAAGSQAVFGFGGTDGINGGAGNDIIHGGEGADIITQTGGSGGRDLVNGGADVDTYQLNGDASAETFTIYSRAAAIAALGAGFTPSLNTEIVITRNGTVIAEIDDVEELVVNTLAVTTPVGSGGGASAGDTVVLSGSFTGTSLNFSTITVNGGAGTDTVDITGLTSDHRIVFNTNGGNDTVIGPARSQDVINIPGRTFNGTTGADQLTGGNGGDTLNGMNGNDTLDGGAGSDVLVGGKGADSLTGGAGSDVFRLDAATDSGVGVALRDVITDFVSGADKLNFNGIDANTRTAGNQDFSFNAVAGTAFSAAGQLRYRYEGAGADEVTLIEGNVNADLAADFQVALRGHHVLTANDVYV